MNEENELKVFSDGEYIFSEIENENQFYFYRQDQKVLSEVGQKPMDMYKIYLYEKMIVDKTTEIITNNIRFDTSDDGKCIRLTTFAFGEKDPLEQPKEKGIKKRVKSFYQKHKRS